MSDQNQTPPKPPKADPKAAKAQEPDGVLMVHEGGSAAAGALLSIGKRKYTVEDGRVRVAPEDFDAAYQAGFRPA